jgi:hypothetical protein
MVAAARTLLGEASGDRTVPLGGGPRIRHFEERNFRAANALTKIGRASVHGLMHGSRHGMRGGART